MGQHHKRMRVFDVSVVYQRMFRQRKTFFKGIRIRISLKHLLARSRMDNNLSQGIFVENLEERENFIRLVIAQSGFNGKFVGNRRDGFF